MTHQQRTFAVVGIAIVTASAASYGVYRAISRIPVRNVEVAQVKEAVIRINLQYDKDRGEHYPKVRNIELQKITSEKSRRPFYFVGLPNSKIANVLVEDCTFKNAAGPSVIENVDNLQLRNFRLLPKEGLDDD